MINDDSTPRNPLTSTPKREKVGSNTYRKFRYQYHWALCRMLDEHREGKEYALFMEEHEDVTLADSLDVNRARFEFSQVKETNKRHTIASLCSKGKKSIIGKLAQSVCDKTFSDRIREARIVSTGGFKFDLHDKGYELETIRADNLSANEIKTIRTHLMSQIGKEDLVRSLAFVVSDLPAKDFENAVKGRISGLVEKMSAGSQCNSGSIYSCVIEDLQRKGENTFDYHDWDEALKRKAITSAQIQEIINCYVTRKNDHKLTDELRQILKDEYGLTSVRRKSIEHAFQRYYKRKLSENSLALNNVSREIKSQIDAHRPTCNDARELGDRVKASLPLGCLEYFNHSDDEVTGAILYEFLTEE